MPATSHNCFSILVTLIILTLIGCGGETPYTSSSSGSISGACALPGSPSWEASSPLVVNQFDDRSGSIHAPSIVNYRGNWHLFASAMTWGGPQPEQIRSVYLSFSDWNEAGVAMQTPLNTTLMGNAMAPQVFYFRPHKLWYLLSDMDSSYATNQDIANVNGWSEQYDLFNSPSNAPIVLDQWVICDETHCYLFFSGADGLYVAKTELAQFPNFGVDTKVIPARSEGKNYVGYMSPSVYKIKGEQRYLMLAMEKYANRSPLEQMLAWQSTSLDGPWELLSDSHTNPFISDGNIQWPDDNTRWAVGIYDGELIRDGYDERQTVDPCNLEFLFNGDTSTFISGGTYVEVHEIGLLRLQR